MLIHDLFLIQSYWNYRRRPKKAEAWAEASESVFRAGGGEVAVVRGGQGCEPAVPASCQTTHWVISNKCCISLPNDVVMYGAIVEATLDCRLVNLELVHCSTVYFDLFPIVGFKRAVFTWTFKGFEVYVVHVIDSKLHTKYPW